MNTIDLNIDNYDLDDILHLFKIQKDFDEHDLKNAKKIVLNSHPDKSNLSPEYFRFFTAAYRTLYSIWEFKCKNNKNKDSYITDETVYKDSTQIEQSKKKVLQKVLNSTEFKDNPSHFNDWFNKQFDKLKMDTDENNHGYGDWLKSNEDIEDKPITMSQLGDEIELKKRQVKALIVHNGINELFWNDNGASNISGDIPDCYSSDLFSNLKYEDLRKAHTETVVPVTMEDYNNVLKFNNVTEYSNYRSSQDMKPSTTVEAQKYFHQKNKKEDEISTERAYKLAKQTEELNKKQNKFWSNLMNIEYG